MVTINIVYSKMKELTKAEEQVMQLLWQLEEGMVKEIIDLMPDPKPAYNTVSTVIRVLEGKGFVDHKAFGNSYVYFPLISEDDYKTFSLNKIMNNYFDNSYKSLVSFIADDKKLSVKELDELSELIEKLKASKK